MNIKKGAKISKRMRKLAGVEYESLIEGRTKHSASDVQEAGEEATNHFGDFGLKRHEILYIFKKAL